MQFSLDKTTQADLKSVNVRSELHGTDHVPAIDIGFEIAVGNAVLAQFDPQLTSMLYERASGSQQREIDGVEPIAELPSLRCSMLGPISIEKEYDGYELTIKQGIDDSSSIVVGQCAVNKFKAKCLDGGTVKLSFRVQASGVEGEVIGRVGSLLGQKVDIVLLAPAESVSVESGVVVPMSAARG